MQENLIGMDGVEFWHIFSWRRNINTFSLQAYAVLTLPPLLILTILYLLGVGMRGRPMTSNNDFYFIIQNTFNITLGGEDNGQKLSGMVTFSAGIAEKGLKKAEVCPGCGANTTER